MKLFSLRKRTARHAARPAHRAEPARISPEDVEVAYWYGYNAAQWCGLPALVKVDKRESFFQARGL